MELSDVMRTTFAAREFTDEAVSDEVLESILEDARFAPSGGNRQGWRVIVVRDSDKRDALKELIRPTFQRYLAQVQAGEAPWNTIDPSAIDDQAVAAVEVPDEFLTRLVAAPLLLLVLVDLRFVASFDQHLDRVGVISGASIYPFVWNVLLSARNRGLGGTLTTFVSAREADVQGLFGLPAHMAVAAMLPMGRPVKQLTRLRRNPVAEFAFYDSLEGPSVGAL